MKKIDTHSFEYFKEMTNCWKKEELQYRCWEICKECVEKNKEIERLNKELQTSIDICNNRQKEIVRLKNQIIIMKKYLKLICNLGYDYDGLNQVNSLKRLIDELVRYASLGRVCNITEPMYIDSEGKKYNILNEELKEGK